MEPQRGTFRVHRTDSNEADIRDPGTSINGGDTTEGADRKKCRTLVVISLLFIALTFGISLYFGLYFGSKGEFCNVSVETLPILPMFFFIDGTDLNNSTSPFPGKYFQNYVSIFWILNSKKNKAFTVFSYVMHIYSEKTFPLI